MQLLIGGGAIRWKDRGSSAPSNESSLALGLRVRHPLTSRIGVLGGVSFQTTGLRGPCTADESLRDKCVFKAGATDAADIGAYVGAAVDVTPALRLGALLSPRLTKQSFDVAGNASYQNTTTMGSRYGLFAELRLPRGVSLYGELQRSPWQRFEPDSVTALANVSSGREARREAWTLGVSLPLSRAIDSQHQVSLGTMFGLTVENDLPLKDYGYTNGLRATANEMPGTRRAARLVGLWPLREPTVCPYRGDQAVSSTGRCHTTQAAIAQTMHTPKEIYVVAPLGPDRPFAGRLFASLRVDLVHPVDTAHRFWVLGRELQVGVLGPSARSEDTQSFAHWTIATGAPRPRGWDSQLSDRWHVAYLIDGSARPWRWMDFTNPAPHASRWRRAVSGDATLRGNIIAGTTQNAGGLGGVLRWSPGTDRTPMAVSRAITPTFQSFAKPVTRKAQDRDDGQAPAGNADSTVILASQRLRYALVTSFDVRGVMSNQTLSAPGVTLRRRLVEGAIGGQVEWKAIAVSAMSVHRSREFTVENGRTDGYARFWTLQFAYRPAR